ncbi:MAG: alanine dehydrogenase [Flavobacteriales bacterium]|nr:alanine dehydrogenase [Flavobacteriales bacterium]
MNISPDALKSLHLLPQEETLEIAKKQQSLKIGLPKETSFKENRIGLVPDTVAYLKALGHNIVIETDAGSNAFFQDKDYSEAGAEIAYNREEIYKSDIVLKISPPTEEEIELCRPGQTVISAIQLTNRYESIIRKLMNKRVNALAFNYIRDEAGVYPVVRSMSEIAGSASILIAGEYLSSVSKGKGLVIGGISGVPPTEVVIIGAGTVGEFAARAALGLGASVKVFDDNIHRLRRFQVDIGQRVYTSLLNQNHLTNALKNADVVIGCMRAPEGRTPCVVSERMVSEMKYGSVIVDVSIDQGGVFETSEPTDHTRPVFKKYGVIHYCVPNISSRVAHTASFALSNIMGPILQHIGHEGGLQKALVNDVGIRSGVYIYNGSLTNKFFADMYNIPFTDLNLIMAAM